METVLCALEQGINLIDTSPFYGNSEYKIGLALQEYGKRESIILSTKAGTHPQLKGYTADVFARSIGQSLDLLKTDYLDIVHIHDPDERDFNQVMEKNGGIKTLLELKEQGVIRYIGLGVRSHALHRQFMGSGLADTILPYMDYNLLNQSAKPLLEEAKTKNIPVLLGSPLCMGLLSGVDPETVRISHYNIGNDVSIAKARDIYQRCLSENRNVMSLNFEFILASGLVTAILAGMVSVNEVNTAMKAMPAMTGVSVFC